MSRLLGSSNDAIAIVDRRGALSFGELQSAIDRTRSGLVELGVRPGDAVLIVTANDRESVVAYHAVVTSGAVAVLTHVGAGAQEIAAACTATTPRLAVIAPAAVERGVELPVGLPRFTLAEVDSDRSCPEVATDPEAPRLIVFTSGTTSVPKGVVHSARSLAAAARCFQTMLELTAVDRLFLVSPLGSITGVLQALELAPAVGAAAVLEQDFDDDRTLDLLVAENGTVYGGPDVVLLRLLSAAERRGIGVPLRIAALGGTMLRKELIDVAERRFGIRVVRLYGSSEAPCSSGTRPDEPEDMRLVDEGRPGPGVELRIHDEGELLVRGPHVFAGYADPLHDEDAFVDGWFRTGDEAQLSDGRLRIVGRLKDIVIRNGKKISLAEVDEAFRAASGIVDCAAFGVNDSSTGERVSIVVRLDDGFELDAPAVLERMESAGLARWKLPESVVRTTEPIPLTPTGKVRRHALSEELPALWLARRLASTSPNRSSTGNY